jgi:hypothetical protein
MFPIRASSAIMVILFISEAIIGMSRELFGTTPDKYCWKKTNAKRFVISLQIKKRK